MPPLLCPSPEILDQSFPRDIDELQIVAEALGNLQKMLENNTVHLLITETLRDLVESFDWNQSGLQALHIDIFNYLSKLFLHPSNRVIYCDVSSIKDNQPHPIPTGCLDEVLVGFWADEVGKLLVKHDAIGNQPKFYIGVACAYAFAGEPKNVYNTSPDVRSFPLVGPNDIPILEDAYEWAVPSAVPQDLLCKGRGSGIMKRCQNQYMCGN